MFVYYNYTLYIYITKQTNNISPLKQTIMTTMTDVKNRLDKVQNLAMNPEFIKSVAETLQANGCSPEEWESNKVYFLMTFAWNYLNKVEENN